MMDLYGIQEVVGIAPHYFHHIIPHQFRWGLGIKIEAINTKPKYLKFTSESLDMIIFFFIFMIGGHYESSFSGIDIFPRLSQQEPIGQSI